MGYRIREVLRIRVYTRIQLPNLIYVLAFILRLLPHEFEFSKNCEAVHIIRRRIQLVVYSGSMT